MKNFTEWREEEQKEVNPVLLIDRLDEIAHGLETELKAFKGERFEGFLELIGSVKALQQNIAALKHQI
jgi:DNA anti-recombination protein RmuC